MSDRVAAAAAELYGADPGEFTARRKALADEARAAGDRDAAKQIMALRKPTRAAWVVKQLSRADPDIPGRLTALAAELRTAAEAADGRKLRELSARRRHPDPRRRMGGLRRLHSPGPARGRPQGHGR